MFVDFEGAMAASTVWLNGQRLGEYRGGYTPFSFELTEHLNRTGENVLAVELDSAELADTPPTTANARAPDDRTAANDFSTKTATMAS